MTKLHLNPSCIIKFPFNTYSNDFTFIVNGKKYETSRVISDILSPKISQIHTVDPTMNSITINTNNVGDFSYILNLVNFEDIIIPENLLPFISEVIAQLNIDSISLLQSNNSIKITSDNVLSLIKAHEKSGQLYSDFLMNEIDFISSHFFELCEKESFNLSSLSESTLVRIFNNIKLKLNDEDQLLNFINFLYSSNEKYGFLYEFVHFENVSAYSMTKFLEIYNINDINNATWNRISNRLKCDVKNNIQNNEKERYSKSSKQDEKEHKKDDISKSFPYSEDKLFQGIINFLNTKSGGKIENEISFTSTRTGSYEYYNPQNVAKFNDKTRHFESQNTPNSWICFDFKDHEVIPMNYTIRTVAGWGINHVHPKNWVIEGSEDKNSWLILDNQSNNSQLNGPDVVHTFKIKNYDSKKFRFIRMRQTGVNWRNDHYLAFDSFKIYGKII